MSMDYEVVEPENGETWYRCRRVRYHSVFKSELAKTYENILKEFDKLKVEYQGGDIS